MNLGLIILLCALLTEAHAVRYAPQETRDQAGQPQSSTAEKAAESKPAEQESSPPAAQEQQAKPPNQPPTQQPLQDSRTEAKPPDQAPELPSSSPTETPSPSRQPEARPAEVTPAEKKTASKPAKASAKKKRSRKTPRNVAGQSSKPRKVIVRDGSTAETITQLAPDMSSADASHSRETTNQLLSSTEANLRRASTRQLSKDQLTMIEQIRTFMGQSNAAVKAGDLQRGHNLALKALLLSNDLVKQ